jgi:hypothetical protein
VYEVPPQSTLLLRRTYQWTNVQNFSSLNAIPAIAHRRTDGRTDDITISVEPIFLKCALTILYRSLTSVWVEIVPRNRTHCDFSSFIHYNELLIFYISPPTGFLDSPVSCIKDREHRVTIDTEKKEHKWEIACCHGNKEHIF